MRCEPTQTILHPGLRVEWTLDNPARGSISCKTSGHLCEELARDLRGRRCVLDGEMVCLDTQGKPQFRDLLFRRAEPFFYAFDLLWDEHAWSDDEQERRRFRNGEDTLSPADRPQASPSSHCAQPRRTTPLLGSCRRRRRRPVPPGMRERSRGHRR